VNFEKQVSNLMKTLFEKIEVEGDGGINSQHGYIKNMLLFSSRIPTPPKKSLLLLQAYIPFLHHKNLLIVHKEHIKGSPPQVACFLLSGAR